MRGQSQQEILAPLHVECYREETVETDHPTQGADVWWVEPGHEEDLQRREEGWRR